MEGKEAKESGKEAKEGKGEEYTCTHPGCSKVLTTKSGLRYHMKTHIKAENQQEAANSQPSQQQGKESKAVLGEEILQQKKQEYNEALIVKALLGEKIQSFRGRPTRATLACHLLTDLIEDITVDLCFEVHRRAKMEPAAFVATRIVDEKNQGDIYGQNPNVNNIRFDCPHCKKPIGGAKFATHLEKCMGLSRSTRTTKSSNTTEKNEIFDLLGDFEDDDDHDTTYSSTDTKKRKKPGPKPSKLKKRKTGPSPTSSPGEAPSPSSPAASNAALPSPAASTPVSEPPPKVTKKLLSQAEALRSTYKREEIKDLLSTFCGAISTSSGKICKNKKCTMHKDEHRQLAHQLLLKDEDTSFD